MKKDRTESSEGRLADSARRQELSRRELIGGVAAVAGARLARPSGRTHRRPNVLLILTDEQRWDSLGSNGNSQAITPNLDRLASAGVRFELPYVTQPVCSPSRSSILTGQYPHRTGVYTNSITLMDHRTSFPRLLHNAGYRTGYIGKWHLGPSRDILKVDTPPKYFDVWRGFNTGGDVWVGKERRAYSIPYDSEAAKTDIPQIPDDPGTYLEDYQTDQAIDFIRSGRRGDPFCLILSYYPPHPPWTAPRENLLRFHGKVKYPTYYAMVNRIDENVGRVLAALDERGLSDNTIIAFASDHGHTFVYRWNKHPKCNCYDSASRVPLFLTWKRALKPRTILDVVSIADLAPTILDLCGLPVPEEMHGWSLRTVLEGKGKPATDYVVIENRPYPNINEGMTERCVVTRQWKLILNTRREPELYNRDQDPEEINNVYKEPGNRGVIADLIRKLEEWGDRTGDGLILRLEPRKSSAEGAD